MKYPPPLFVAVEVWNGDRLFRKYVIDHDDAVQRRTLGEQCRNAFEGGQRIVTYATTGDRHDPR